MKNFKWPRIPLFNPLKLSKISKRLQKQKKRFTWKKALQFSLYVFLTVLFLTALLFAWFSKDLPTPGAIKRRYVIQSSRIYARDGKTPLYNISGDFNRQVIDKKDMPIIVRDATIAIEDKDFYRHMGVDFRGVIRAIYNNVTHKRSYLSGGSTITQQFVKNALLSPKKTITRKIKELILSIEIEIMYSKEDILTMYLNEIPYGSNAYGVEAASQAYFNKKAKDLTLSEAATLAALPQAPTYYYNHKDALTARRNLVLKKMVQQGYIKQEEADTAKKDSIKFTPRKENIVAPHFVMYVKEVLVEKYGEKMVEEGGLRVTTTLDMDKQKIAEQVINDQKGRLNQYKASNAGLVALDPKTGQVLAMIGSIDYFDIENDGNFNVTTGQRQPGSSIKPLVYAAAFEDKYNPATTLFDLKTDFGNYTPQNYNGNFQGPVTVRYALGNSLNIPAVKALGLIGTDKAIDKAHEMGITTLQDRERYGLALVLGGGEVRPLDMATAYGVFANSGKLAPTTPILKVEDANGKVIEEYKKGKDEKEALKPEVAYEISHILSDVNAKKPTFSFALKNLTLSDRPVAVKTGTTNNYRDAWTIGYTPSLVTTVWAGNNDNTSMTPSGGAIGAAPIWHDFMQKSLAGTKKEDFWRPEGIQEKTVDRLSNKLVSDATPDSEKIKDIFASWQIPTEKDNVHKKVKVCKANGLLAPKDAPADFIEDRIYTEVHSERPDKSNWEEPVIAWAKQNGLYNPPPTQSCDINSIQPTISISSPANNADVSGSFTITASVSSGSGIQEVEFFIDDIKIGSDSNDPYSINYNANELSNGNHEVAVRATSSNGTTNRATITIKVGNDTTPPGNISGANGDSPSAHVATLSWTNPSDADLANIRIYVSLVAGSLGTLKTTVSASPSAAQTITISGLTSGPNYFTLRTVDSSGNERPVSSPQIVVNVK